MDEDCLDKLDEVEGFGHGKPIDVDSHPSESSKPYKTKKIKPSRTPSYIWNHFKRMEIVIQIILDVCVSSML